jgi:sugar phosphate isomerase/epimerase
MSSRRRFLHHTALTVAATGIGSLLPGTVEAATEKKQAFNLLLGMAGYTFLNFNADQAIAMMKRVGVTELSIKDFHLPLDSSADKIKEVFEKFRSNGINIYAAGVIYMRSEKEVDRAFNYAKNAALDLIVGVPTVELLPYTENQVKTHNIRIAIHNHGPEDKLYPSPADVYERIKKMDKRMGLCLDIGHSLRAGKDPVKAVYEYAPRLFDLHIKDLVSSAKDAKGTVLGRGVIDIPGLVKALKKIRFGGRSSIEFEIDMKDPLAGIAESVGYFRGVVKSLA